MLEVVIHGDNIIAACKLQPTHERSKLPHIKHQVDGNYIYIVQGQTLQEWASILRIIGNINNFKVTFKQLKALFKR